ncbi:ribosome hibernation-promoting factor, HPF/YfiA family [Aureimonas phyllosphaerae]|uniref:Ribosome hibernation promoting factor n=1 Tax=Aureimonas phyllosphaerae TaxID=1166078 RepID=A0A7W6BW44_9HYPH|nr:ribosome-associated translation inhibitor RaiA [Aureimonas phyllosphaerae]MBB3937445.1 ribosomal subunit interface protein [Aureimonas phyllosphaerae]MBB3961489.1 ribosomal subunit interface protein [Aureimonas phyllosphaerae]SFF38665.1 ribosomal subunit interface protein [Aureimonas phyllosphaerae]
MGLRVSGRHMDVGEAFRSRIEDRLNDLVAKYFDGNFSGATVLSKEGARYSADITLHLDSGVDFQATADTHDPESSFTEASEKIEKRLRRYKRRLKDHKANAAASREIAYTVISSVPEEDDEVPEDFAPAVIAETSLVMGTMSVASAVMELDRRDGPVVVFKNGATEEVNIVYRRPDGNVGWIDPSTLRARV